MRPICQLKAVLFLLKKIYFLGYIISSYRIRIKEKKIEVFKI